MTDKLREAVDAAVVSEWKKKQAELRSRLELSDRVDFGYSEDAGEFVGLRLVGGVDISYPRGCSERAVAALVILEYPSMRVVHKVIEHVPIEAPYIAGFLAFREMAAYQTVFKQLASERPELVPQVVIVDGNGTLHPRRFGSACHIGVELDVPTVGVAKNFIHIDDLETDAHTLKGKFRADPQLAEVELAGKESIYGMAIAPTGQAATNPIFVSPGHRISLRTAVRLVRRCSFHRIPEPIRIADQGSRVLARKIEAEL